MLISSITQHFSQYFCGKFVCPWKWRRQFIGQHTHYNNVSIKVAVRTPWSASYNLSSEDSQESLPILVTQTALKRAALWQYDLNAIESRIKREYSDHPTRTSYLIESSSKQDSHTDTLNPDDINTEIKKGEDNSAQKFWQNLQKIEKRHINTLIFSEYSVFGQYPLKSDFHAQREESLQRFLKAQANHYFDGEIMTVPNRRRLSSMDGQRQRCLMHYVSEDDSPFCRDNDKGKKMEAASTIVFQDRESLQTIDDFPESLVDVCSFSLLTGNDLDETHLILRMREALKEMFSVNGLTFDDIDVWLTSGIPMDDGHLSRQLGVKQERVNYLGITNIYGRGENSSQEEDGGGAFFNGRGWFLTHAVHHTKPGNYCCLLRLEPNSSLEIFLLRGRFSRYVEARKLPLLTLFTKSECLLCDQLVEQLEEELHGQFHLEKIYIDQDVNGGRYLQLYEFDIPVVFLNGQFLGMHRLNTKLLHQRLKIIEESMKCRQCFPSPHSPSP